MDRTADALIGRVLDGRYRVGARIARGGMATVYEATDLRLDRTVAVKVMHEGLADDDEFVRRFQREARSAARLAHHNVVAVFDTGDDNGTLFLVMEYVPGLTLRDLIRKEAPMSPAKALSVIEPVLAHWPLPTMPGSCTATSSPRTSCSPTTGGSRSPTSVWRARSTPRPSTRPPAAYSSAPSPTSPPSSWSTGRPTREPTSTRSA